jgi:broad specificity phosphatase PhoE
MISKGTFMTSRKIYLVRHGHREDFFDNSEQINREWVKSAENPFDPGLSSLGKAQARQLADKLKFSEINHIFSSPFLRTVETASIIASCFELKMKIENGLCEWLNPGWFPTPVKFLGLNALSLRFPQKIDTSYHSMVNPVFPEPLLKEHVWPRVAKTVNLLLKCFDGNLLLVGHGASITAAAFCLAAAPVDITTRLCGLILFKQVNNKWKLVLDGSS